MGSKQEIRQIIELLERLDAALVVRDPGSARSADAFEGLRRQLNQASKNRRTHISHLLSIQDSIGRGGDFELVKARVEEFIDELGLKFVSETSNADYFEIVGGSGDGLACTKPAVVEVLDDGNSSLVRLGEAVRVPGDSGAADMTRVDSRGPIDVVDTTRPMMVAIGVTIAIVGFFFGWVIASGAQSDSSPSDRVAVTHETVIRG